MWKMNFINFIYNNKLKVSAQGAWIEHDGFNVRVNSGFLGALLFTILIENTSSININDIQEILNKRKCCKLKKIHHDQIEIKYLTQSKENELELRSCLNEIICYLKQKNILPSRLSVDNYWFLDEAYIFRCNLIMKAWWLKFLALISFYFMFEFSVWINGQYSVKSIGQINTYLSVSIILTLLVGTTFYLLSKRSKGLAWYIFSDDDFNVKERSMFQMVSMRLAGMLSCFSLIYECVKYYASTVK